MSTQPETVEVQATASARGAETLRRRIWKGVYPPHTFLPSERQLAEELNCGRRAIRIALGRLVAEGLVARAHGRGVRVLPSAERQSQCTVGVAYLADPPGQVFMAQETNLLLTGIQSALFEKGYRHEVVLLTTPEMAAQPGRENCLPLSEISGMTERFGACLFLESLGTEDHIRQLAEGGFPVAIANLEDDAVDVSATWVDHHGATVQAVNTLLSLGHRRIAFLGRTPGTHFYGRALDGYCEALKTAGVARRDADIGLCGKTDALSAYLETRRFLDQAEPPTALVAARDILAEGACKAIEEAGQVVGRDISVIGFDDFSWPQNPPFLTTFREPCFEMGAAAVEILLRQIAEGAPSTEKREIPAPFVLRKSAAPNLET